MAEIKPIVGPVPVTLERAAEVAGVTEKTIRSWIDEGLAVLQAGKQGRGAVKTLVDLVDVFRWMGEQDALDVARTRQHTAAAEKIEMENAERRGDLARVSVMNEAFADAVVTSKALLLAIPTKEARMLAAITDANAIEHRLTTAINDALRQLATYGARGARKRRASGRKVDGSVRAAAPPDGKRVGRGKQVTQ